ncbi:Protein CBG25894 [Caenorhabditis briggsae]|uniref:Protein CBG25894 n=2 Tax=Caenorhabditis briggsae TaxID=6238 RepID=B6IHP9_CAEBR|nr:Protein CBG25894 [Caenorhabditis briggsae]ULU01736.1 hypothetical protein L3Y34_001793 [Caenorhabditis briggsae]CAR99405.1 Protein CBG25894 [Caenorhabditis briggsae]
MNLWFFTLLALISLQLAPVHSDNHVQSKCGRRALEHIQSICPTDADGNLCLTGEFPITKYCAQGLTDSEIYDLCCPTNEHH